MYNLIEYSNNYSKTSGSLWQYCKDEPNDNLENSESFKSKVNSTGEGRFTITDTKLYVPVVTLSIEDNSKLLQQLKSGFTRTINWNKYQSDRKTCAQNRYLNHLVNQSFQGVNRRFIVSFKNENDRTSHSNYYLPKVEIKDYNVMIDGKNFLDQTINSDLKT